MSLISRAALTETFQIPVERCMHRSGQKRQAFFLLLFPLARRQSSAIPNAPLRRPPPVSWRRPLLDFLLLLQHIRRTRSASYCRGEAKRERHSQADILNDLSTEHQRTMGATRIHLTHRSKKEKKKKKCLANLRALLISPLCVELRDMCRCILDYLCVTFSGRIRFKRNIFPSPDNLVLQEILRAT